MGTYSKRPKKAKYELREVPKPESQGPKISLSLSLHGEKEGWGKVLGCDMSVVVTPTHSESKGFWGLWEIVSSDAWQLVGGANQSRARLMLGSATQHLH